MVEAMRVTSPLSMTSSRDCCCFLLKYWISSRYSRMPLGAIMVPTSPITSFTSERDPVVALIRRRVRPDCLAMMFATVVFPVPDGP